MARIAGVDLPREKRVEIGLTYIYGIGLKSSQKILSQTGINPDTRVKDLTEADVSKLREVIDAEYTVEGDLRRQLALDIKRLMEIGCYRGIRHRRGLPVRGHVEDVIWYDDAMDITVPTEMLPDKLREGLFNGNATMMIALFDNTTSADSTMDAITEMRGIVKKQAFISGMSGVVTDIKNLAMAEMPIYVVVAAVLSLLILLLTMDSLVTPFIFLLGIGMAIVYNMGTNMVFGEISYITQALTAILQLGVTMDYSIFLLESYEANKVRTSGPTRCRYYLQHS